MSSCRFCEMLSPIEIESIIPKIVKMLQQAVSRGAAINEDQIQARLAFKGLYVPQERMRIMIAYIRINSLVPALVFGPTGFFIATDSSTVMDQVSALRFIATLMGAEAAALEEQIQITTH